MDYMETKVKKIIRERIWQGILHGSKAKNLENPAAINELLEQSQEFLNEETEKAWGSLTEFATMLKEGDN